MRKLISIMDEKWDYLIILDACRYDYFLKLYRDYLQGKLEKVWSQGSHTSEWCKESFKEYYKDVIYVSANPYINSKVQVGGFNARSHFFKVFDVWDYGWDEELGTVHPQRVNEAIQNLKEKYSDKRFIIHYLQPHAPYYALKVDFVFNDPQVFLNSTRFKKNKTYKIVTILASLAEQLGLLGGNPSWKIRELLKLSPATPLEAARRKVGDIGLRHAYEENLKIVLNHIAHLVETLSGIIIVTSDHGELLGEDDCYDHYICSDNPILREIPWLKIEKKKNKKDFEEKKRIIKKIKQLKDSKLI